jgi:NAD dependent epimerase/dehydratase family enzyme
MSPKKVAIAGSTGYLAGELMKELKDYEIIKLVREDFHLDNRLLAEKINAADVIINLAGYPIIKRWTKSNRRKIGNGRQWMSFVHIYDLVHSIRFIIEKELEGIVNVTDPEYITNKEFTKAMSELIHKPAFLTVPVFLLKLFYGKGAEIIYSGNRVLPEKLLNQGFKFKYSNINSALEEIIFH